MGIVESDVGHLLNSGYPPALSYLSKTGPANVNIVAAQAYPRLLSNGPATMVNRYFLMRHGESQANRADLIISDPQVGCKLYGLTNTGKAQARASAEASGLTAETRIVCSDFKRARETARVVQQVLGVRDVQVEPGLRERYFGKLDGQSGSRYQEVWAVDSVELANTPFGAESPLYLARRLQKTMQKLEQQFQNETLLLVSHGDPLRFLQLLMSDRSLKEHAQLALFEPAEIRALDDLKPR